MTCFCTCCDGTFVLLPKAVFVDVLLFFFIHLAFVKFEEPMISLCFDSALPFGPMSLRLISLFLHHFGVQDCLMVKEKFL